MENKIENKELQCRMCVHANVCKYDEINKQAFEKLLVNKEYQDLVNNGIQFESRCKYFYHVEKIIGGSDK